MLVCIDAGHGGNNGKGDPGAVARDGTKEADINLAFAQRLGHYLRSRGHKTLFTRTALRSPSLAERCTIANEGNADLFVSIHCNSHTDPKANGSEVLYRTAQGLAIALQTELLREGRLNNRGVKQRTDLYVLKHTRMPAVLVELGFLSNETDLRFLKNERWRENVACVLARALDEWGKRGGEAA